MLPSFKAKTLLKQLTTVLAIQATFVQIASAQTITLSGPTCVLANRQYFYQLQGSGIYSYATTWNIYGGKVAGTTNTTQISGMPYPAIYIEWDGSSTGFISATLYDAFGNSIASPYQYVTKYNPITPGNLSNTSQTIAYNTFPATISSASGASGGYCNAPAYSYQWQQSTASNGTYYDIAGATGLNLGFSAPLTTTTYYRRLVTDANSGASASTTPAVVNVAAAGFNGGCITSADQSIGAGAIPATITASAAVNGSCAGNYQYQWQSSPDSIYFTNIPGATGQNLTFSTGVTQTTYYQRRTVCGTEVRYTGRSKVTTGQLTFKNEWRYLELASAEGRRKKKAAVFPQP